MRLSRLTSFLAIAAMSIGLAACGTTGGLPASGTTSPPVVSGPVSSDATVAAIQDAAAKVCAFVPTVSTITGIIANFISGGVPVNALVTSVATSICNAVAPTTAKAKAARTSGPPNVGGVPVEGYFLAK